MDRVESELNYPVFVKPSSAGSSKGVTKAHDRAELEAGLHEALNHDSKILVEETIVGRELECGVLGYGNHTKASGVGEILAAANADFYDLMQNTTMQIPRRSSGQIYRKKLRTRSVQKQSVSLMRLTALDLPVWISSLRKTPIV